MCARSEPVVAGSAGHESVLYTVYGLPSHTTCHRQLNAAWLAGSARHGPVTYADLRVVVSLH